MRLLIEQDYVSMKSMIEEAKRRNPEVKDIFQITPDSKLEDPFKYIRDWYSSNKIPFTAAEYNKIKEAVLHGRIEHKKTIEGYLDSEGLNKNYPKIPPAFVYKNGRADGKHRAMLALLLGISIPVIREV